MNSALLSLIGFSVAMYITPGPNNVMVAASAANNGIRATVPHMFGIAVGLRGHADPGLRRPWLRAGELAVAAAAVPLGRRRVARCARLADRRRTATRRGRPRPRARLHRRGGIPVDQPQGLADRRRRRRRIPVAEPAARRCSSRASSSCSSRSACRACWCGRLLGSGAGRLLHSPVRLRAFNIAMALLLVASLVPVLIEG